MQADLAKVGIKAKIVSYDWVKKKKKTKQGEHQMCLLGWTGDNADPDNFLNVLLSEAAAKIPAQNFAFWKNKEFNDLINKAKVVADVKQRTALYEKAQEVFAADAPWVTIANSVVVAPVLAKVNGLQLDPIGKRRFKEVWLTK